METLTHFLILPAISSCLSLLVGANVASAGLSQQNSSKDSIKVEVESSAGPQDGKTFQLLPKYYHGKDTAEFKLIPKHYDDADFVPVDKEPQIVRKVEPGYPDAARGSGLEGKVIVKMWVDTTGKVGRVVVLKSDAEVFNAPAIEAAKQFVFTPAYKDKRPVATWVSCPFRFKSPLKK